MSAALDLLAGLILDDGRPWGAAATDWQWEDARAVLEPGRGPRLHFVTRPRSGSKTTDLAGVLVAALVEQIPAGGRAYAIATDRDQARLLVDAMAGLVGRTPGLAGAIKVDRYMASTPGGAALEVIAADAPSAYGLRGHLFVCDELTMWPVEARPVWVAILSAVPKVRGARLVVLASAGDPAHWSFKIRERARTSSRWRLHEVAGPVPWVDAADLEEQRALLTDSQFARLHLNRWCASEDRLVSVEGLAAAVTLDGPQEYVRGTRYAIGADIGLRNDRTALVVAHSELVDGDGRARRRIVLDRLVVFGGTREAEVSLAEVEAALLEMWRMYGRPKVRLDPWQAIGLAQRLRGHGVRVEEYSYSPQRYGAAASALFGLLRDGLLALYPHEGLLDELANVRLRETVPGQVRVDHDPGKHDDQVTAVGFAVTALLERPGRAGPGSFRMTTGTPVVSLIPSRSGPASGEGPVPVVDPVTRQPKKAPAARSRVESLVPRELRHRFKEGYTPPRRDGWR